MQGSSIDWTHRFPQLDQASSCSTWQSSLRWFAVPWFSTLLEISYEEFILFLLKPNPIDVQYTIEVVYAVLKFQLRSSWRSSGSSNPKAVPFIGDSRGFFVRSILERTRSDLPRRVIPASLGRLVIPLCSVQLNPIQLCRIFWISSCSVAVASSNESNLVSTHLLLCHEYFSPVDFCIFFFHTLSFWSLFSAFIVFFFRCMFQ